MVFSLKNIALLSRNKEGIGLPDTVALSIVAVAVLLFTVAATVVMLSVIFTIFATVVLAIEGWIAASITVASVAVRETFVPRRVMRARPMRRPLPGDMIVTSISTVGVSMLVKKSPRVFSSCW